MGILGILLVGVLAVLLFLVVAAVIGAFFAWRVIAPTAKQFRLQIDPRGVRAFTEHGEVVPGSVIYKQKHDATGTEKPKRFQTLGADGELEDMEIEDADWRDLDDDAPGSEAANARR